MLRMKRLIKGRTEKAWRQLYFEDDAFLHQAVSPVGAVHPLNPFPTLDSEKHVSMRNILYIKISAKPKQVVLQGRVLGLKRNQWSSQEEPNQGRLGGP